MVCVPKNKNTQFKVLCIGIVLTKRQKSTSVVDYSLCKHDIAEKCLYGV